MVGFFLYKTCYHEITYGKINLSVPSPPSYKRKFWEYKNANIVKIRHTLQNIDWNEKFQNLHVDSMTDVFCNSLMTVLIKHIPNKIFTFNDRDPPWMTREIKTAIKRKHRVCKKFNSRGRNPADWERVRILRNETIRLVDAAENNYFKSLGRKLTDIKTGIKAYWHTINKKLNKNKVTCIPPLLEDDAFVTNFQTKAVIINEHFVQQCSLINNSSQLPAFISKTSSVLEKFPIDSAKILSLIRSLNTNKALHR